MATPEENARRLLKALVGAGHQAEVAIPHAQVQTTATEAGIDGEDQDAALESAGAKGWIADGPRAGTVVITRGGWDNRDA
jgi:hypothetical protein